MRVDAIAGISFALTTVVVCNAFYKKEQFYPSVVYLTKSNPSMAVIYIQALVLVVLFGKLLRKIFFGQLRAAETEHLIERSWYAVTETCLAFTVFRDDFSPRFIALFTVLLFLKCFHWLVEDRVDFMERSPAISPLFHVRAVVLLALLTFLDLFFIHHAYHSTLIKGASVQLVFGFEYAILLANLGMIGDKYIMHTIDLHRENPWEYKSVYLLYSELVLGFAKVVLYIVFMAIMIKVHTLPLFAIRPMYLTTRAFKKAVHDVIMSRRAIRNMNSLYPNATAEDFESADNVCIICREEMQAAPAAAPAGGVARGNANGAGAKKLPCGHIFHVNCLRSWFQRQQTCPTCRIDILRQPSVTVVTPGNRDPNEVAARAAAVLDRARAAAMAVAAGANPPPAGDAAAAAAPAAPNGNQPRAQAGVAFFGPFFPPPPPPPPSTSAETANAPRPPFPAFPFPPPIPPPFMFPPHAPPHLSPPSTSDLSSLTEEQLRTTESEERSRVEARIHMLRNIQSLLDAAVAQMNLYVNGTAVPAAVETTAVVSVAEASTTAVAAVVAASTSTATEVSSNASVAVASTTSLTLPSTSEAPAPRPATAESGAIPKLPPKLSKIAANESSQKTEGDAAAASTADEDDDDDDEKRRGGGDSETDAGDGDAGKDDQSEIRRRRLQKLVSETSPSARCGVEEESKE